MAFVSSNNTNSNCNSNTNEADNTAHAVSATHNQCNSTSRDNLSDAMICAFLASQLNSPQLAREDLEQIDPGLKWSATIVINMLTLQENVEFPEIRKTEEERIIEEL
ncbi:hypothetical protein Tco_0301391 [Tanacetum coccineum]